MWLQCSAAGPLWHNQTSSSLLNQQEHRRYPQHHHRHPCHQQLLLQIQRCQHSQAHSLLSVQAEEPYSAPFKTFRKELWRKHTRVTTVLPGSAEATGYTRIEFPLPLLCYPGTRTFWSATDSPAHIVASHAVAPFYLYFSFTQVAALPHLDCIAMLTTPFFIWFQEFCSLAAVSGTASSMWLNKTENRNDHDQGELMHFFFSSITSSLFFSNYRNLLLTCPNFFTTSHPAVTHLTYCTESAYFVWDNPKKPQPSKQPILHRWGNWRIKSYSHRFCWWTKKYCLRPV